MFTDGTIAQRLFAAAITAAMAAGMLFAIVKGVRI